MSVSDVALDKEKAFISPEEPGEDDDKIEAFFSREGDLYLEIDRPWDGDSATGFGRQLHFELSEVEARRLYEWLDENLMRIKRDAYLRKDPV